MTSKAPARIKSKLVYALVPAESKLTCQFSEFALGPEDELPDVPSAESASASRLHPAALPSMKYMLSLSAGMDELRNTSCNRGAKQILRYQTPVIVKGNKEIN